MSDDRTVAFYGERAATDVLTWGQRAIWTAIQRTRPADAYFNFGRTVPVSGVDAATVLAAIGTVMGRHEALRTRVSVVDGEPRQVVSSAGEITVPVVEGDAERISAGYVATAFDYEHEWPVRFCVVTTDGEPTSVVVCFCHLASDFGGSVFVLRDLVSVIAGEGVADGPGWQPVDLAAYQRSASGVRAAKAAADYWARAYDRIPVSMFEREIAEPEQPRYQRVFLVSPALGQAAAVLGDRLGTGSAAVLNGAFASVIGELTGHSTCAILTITKNRFREQTRDMVSTLALEGLLVVPLAGDFDDVVRTAWKAAVPAYRYAQYDERDRDRVVEQASARRGAHVHPYCCLNDLRDEEEAPLADTSPRDLLDRSLMEWAPPLAKLSCRFCLHVANSPFGLSVRLTADTAYVPKPAMTRFLTRVEEIVVRAADRIEV